MQAIDDDDDLDLDAVYVSARNDHTIADLGPPAVLMELVMAHIGPEGITPRELFELLDDIVELAGGSIEKAIADLESGRMVIRDRE
jgi:hypothetical protein